MLQDFRTASARVSELESQFRQDKAESEDIAIEIQDLLEQMSESMHIVIHYHWKQLLSSPTRFATFLELWQLAQWDYESGEQVKQFIQDYEDKRVFNPADLLENSDTD